MSLSSFFRKMLGSQNVVDHTPMTVNVKKEGTLADIVASNQAEIIANLKLEGTLNGDDFTYLHKAFKALEILDLAKVKIAGGRFVCGKHKNYYDLGEDELSAHTLHIGSLRSVILPESVKEIVLSGFSSLNFGMCDDSNELARMSGAFAFDLESIIVPSENKYFSSFDGVLYDKGMTELLKCPYSHSGNISFPSTLRKIHENALRECENFSRIAVPEGVTAIGENAFFGCGSLKELSYPSTLVELGDDTFSHCFSLEKMTCGSSEPLKMELTRRTNIADCKLYVPEGAESAYSVAPFWSDFKKISLI